MGVNRTHSDKITERRFIVKRKQRHPVSPFIHNRGMTTPGDRLKGLRKERRLTQPQVAEATGVPQSTLSEIERGESRTPSSEVLLKLAEFYEAEPKYILTGQGPRHAVTSKGDSETELLLYYRSLSSEGQAYLLSRAKDLHQDEHRRKPEDPPKAAEPAHHHKRKH